MQLDQRVDDMDAKIKLLASSHSEAKGLLAILGIDPITATALICAIGDGSQFKRGDSYLRTLLIHGARSVLRVAGNKDDPRSRWLKSLCPRRNKNIAVVALANKNARIVRALIAHYGQSIKTQLTG